MSYSVQCKSSSEVIGDFGAAVSHCCIQNAIEARFNRLNPMTELGSLAHR